MRLFIAVNIPEHVRNLITKKVNLIKNEVAQNLKWVKPENWHLTLKFLGEINENKVSEIKSVLSMLKHDFNSFPVRLNKIGAFPHLEHPKVLYISLGKGENEIINIYKYLD
jgi:2'-5' RNA ligase